MKNFQKTIEALRLDETEKNINKIEKKIVFRAGFDLPKTHKKRINLRKLR